MENASHKMPLEKILLLDKSYNFWTQLIVEIMEIQWLVFLVTRAQMSISVGCWIIFNQKRLFETFLFDV